jgi:hypothetical protein
MAPSTRSLLLTVALGLVQDQLALQGKDHELYMVDKGVSMHPLLFENVVPYVAGEATLDAALDVVMASVARQC